MAALLWTSVVLLTITFCQECRGSEAARNNDTKAGCLRSADVVFALDASNTIWPPDFRKQLRFVSSVIQELPIGPKSIRSGVVTFSHVVRVEFGLAAYSGAAAASAAASRVTQLGGNTRTDLVLQRLRTMFNQEGRLDADRIAVVVTDGVSDDPPATARAAEDLRSDGVTLIAIGVGNRTDRRELETIASARELTLSVENYDALDRVKRLITTKACVSVEEEKEEQRNDTRTDNDDTIQNTQDCSDNPTDILFILDSSRSITRTEFLQQLKFVKDTVALLSVSASGGARVAVLTFGDAPRLHFAFDRYSTVTDIQEAVDRIAHQAAGRTDTAGALRYARLNSFAGAGRGDSGGRGDSSGDRRTTRLAVVVTDGKSDDAASTIHEARLLRAEGVVIFAVGVGAQVDARELGAIASPPSASHFFTADGYSDLDSVGARLVGAQCQGDAAEEKGCPTRRPGDVVFALPGSIDDADTAAGLRFVASTASRVQEGPSRVRVGLVPRLCHAVSGFSLDEGIDSDRVALYVDNQRPTGQVDETAAALRYMRDISYGAGRGRLEGQRGSREAAKVAVVVVDGKAARVKATTVSEANRLKEQGVLVMVVSVGGGKDAIGIKELRGLAGCQKCLLSADGYASLGQVVEPLAGVVLDHLCDDEEDAER